MAMPIELHLSSCLIVSTTLLMPARNRADSEKTGQQTYLMYPRRQLGLHHAGCIFTLVWPRVEINITSRKDASGPTRELATICSARSVQRASWLSIVILYHTGARSMKSVCMPA